MVWEERCVRATALSPFFFFFPSLCFILHLLGLEFTLRSALYVTGFSLLCIRWWSLRQQLQQQLSLEKSQYLWTAVLLTGYHDIYENLKWCWHFYWQRKVGGEMPSQRFINVPVPCPHWIGIKINVWWAYAFFVHTAVRRFGPFSLNDTHTHTLMHLLLYPPYPY